MLFLFTRAKQQIQRPLKRNFKEIISKPSESATQSQPRFSNYDGGSSQGVGFQIIDVYWPESCTSEFQLKVNYRLKVNCRIKFGLAQPTDGRPAQILSYNSLSVYNSLSAAIHLYMIRTYSLSVCLAI